ncbi:hypothetical protein D3C85_1186760 [compost metagenome]
MTKFVYVIQDKQGVPFEGVEFSRKEARAAKRYWERLTTEKLKIVRYTVDRPTR